MAELVMGAMGSLIPKLGELLKEEYSLQTGVKERISNLTKELVVAQAALHKVADVPWDQLDEQVRLWACEVRESSYDMEDVVDTFLVRVQGPDSAEQEESLFKRLKKMVNFLKKTKVRRKISGDVKDIMSHLQVVTERCRRYKVHDIVVSPATRSTVDPRLHAMYNNVKYLVGIDKSREELISKLQPPQRDDVSNMKVKTVSIVGVGGLGKTTLAKAVYNKLKGDFNCGAFVPVGQNPSLEKLLKDILMDLDWRRRHELSTAVLDQRQLIDELRSFLETKRYFIVIDDLWEKQSWETIKLAIDDDNNCGGRILITTRKLEVAEKADYVYKLPPLPNDSSRKLFHTRINGDERKYVIDYKPDEICDDIIRKCGGIPLAIITMASLLVRKPRNKWSEICKSICFGGKDDEEAENTMRILSFSYYDLPAHLRTCLLYLSAFPEDSVIDKGSLVWMWVAEGFVHKIEGMRLFEIGEGYFNDLINRSMIQAVEYDYDDTIIIGCRVHDMVLDFIRSISRKENFFTILNNNQDTQLEKSVHRLANHNWTKGSSHQGNHTEMPKLRSFIALGCVIETWTPLCSFTYLRVVAIENYSATDGSSVRIEHLGRLLLLRFLSLRGTRIGRIPEGIGALSFLQTLDFLGSDISEMPSSGVLPKQLVCLCITFAAERKTPSGHLAKQTVFGGTVFSVEVMTSLEELTIEFIGRSCLLADPVGWLVKGLGCLRELRVLNICFKSFDEEEGGRDLVESLGHLDKLERLTICGPLLSPKWQAKDLVLSHDLQHLVVNSIYFSELPSCINPWRLPSLSHLDLSLLHMDEEDLKSLGGLPELYYLSLALPLWYPVTIPNISDSDACYFPKLRCFKLKNSMFSFTANKDDSVSFHIWYGLGTSRTCVSDDENRGSTICSQGAATEAPRFMPRLQVLNLDLRSLFAIPNWLNNCNLGWEHLSSLQEINADLEYAGVKNIILEMALRRAASVHPNHPTLRMKIL
ncbi:hypothetical protein BDA96_05G243800 [Sorghum bicolor]|uniref:AAA+ ATPase domain-containing protein n=2 Tax=Sorghum bicolor TaxID=4558 RepID=A0A921R2E9_SORBI|nr:hypothetical protein SORBI_3005G226400 [Sorghum bicolor]KAG0531090.1 hypothetical protein BDA96_05G243800 [Sorghum bicolor]